MALITIFIHIFANSYGKVFGGVLNSKKISGIRSIITKHIGLAILSLAKVCKTHFWGNLLTGICRINFLLKYYDC